MNKLLENCKLCPRNCGVNRINNQTGFCSATDKLKVARASLHMWEEPCISGTNGSGTIFFSHCSLKCIFCQNNNISQNNFGKEITIERLAEIFIELQNRDANNINLVTPTHYVPQIIEAIKLAKQNGLNIPIVYNSSGYENVETIKLLNGYIDIYLPDFKYFDNDLAIKLSNTPNYFIKALACIDEMVSQIKENVFDENGIMQKGVIIRHLILPGHTLDSKKIIKELLDRYKNKVYISLMSQYTPIKNLPYTELNRKLSKTEYNRVVDYALNLGLVNGFIQDGESAKESFIPDFDISGV
ncbi:MAG: radical SAM protein [Clostridiales bacterium]|nr:radical SAM protein [Clostridiales bacterium]